MFYPNLMSSHFPAQGLHLLFSWMVKLIKVEHLSTPSEVIIYFTPALLHGNVTSTIDFRLSLLPNFKIISIFKFKCSKYPKMQFVNTLPILVELQEL